MEFNRWLVFYVALLGNESWGKATDLLERPLYQGYKNDNWFGAYYLWIYFMKHIKPKLEPHSKILAQALKDPKVKKEYDALDNEYKEMEKNIGRKLIKEYMDTWEKLTKSDTNVLVSRDVYTELKGLPTDEVYDLGLRMCGVLTFIYGIVVGVAISIIILLLTGTI